MIGKFEANKDLIQELTSSGARHVGNIATIITATVADVTREVGEWITDAIEMKEAAGAARRDAKESEPAAATQTAGTSVADADSADAGPVGGDAFDLLDAEVVASDPAEPEFRERR
ncbi:hypothetical protein [Nocardia shimofusensis]|uniref:hypothetical protein n=1 Tax=Nocardia shimofusensis TaxID=228596 RepID=UPI000835D27B|nr:hypothetical protein [Nocardia shimofusensis]